MMRDQVRARGACAPACLPACSARALSCTVGTMHNPAQDVFALVGERVTLSVKPDKIEFPSSVEALITSRMDRLPPSQQQLMKIASVMGTRT